MYDLIVIGGGPGGYHASERASCEGLSVLCIEKKSLGGVCLNEGCIPTKTLLYSAKLYEGAGHGEKYGVFADNLTINHKKVLARKNRVIRMLGGGIKNTLKAKGVDVINGEARITGKSEAGFEVQVGEEKCIGKKLLIAAGSIPAIPLISGLMDHMESGFVLDNSEILNLEDIPEKLVIIGGGVIGLEMASYFCSAGSRVTIIEMLEHIAGQNDIELTEILKKNYEKKGMEFRLGAKVTEIVDEGVKYQLNGEEQLAFADKVLLSIGRVANTKGLGLETIGVALEHGAIVTDDYMRTNIKDVYAVGDINGKSMLAHTAFREAEVAVNGMIGTEDGINYDAIPAVIYTNPELASVGITEAAAIKIGMNVQVVKIPMNYSGRYMAENEGGDGLCKLIVNQDTKKVVGMQALANYASEFVASATIFIEMGMDLKQIKKVIFPHPTVCEILHEIVLKAND